MIAKLRYWYWRHLRRYESEICQRCGRPVGQVWHARDDIWECVVGSHGGILCIPCFDKLVMQEYAGRFLYWTAGFEPEPFYTSAQLQVMADAARRSIDGGVYVYLTGEARSEIRLATIEGGPGPKNRRTVYRIITRQGNVIRDWERNEDWRELRDG